MNELALFAGAGGGILAGQMLGWRTVCAVERDAYPAAVLAQRQNDGLLDLFPIWSDVQTFDGKPWRGIVDVISGGFPCQDISPAGNGAGIDGARSGMWREMARIIREVRPQFVFVENSPALTARGLGRVFGDLAEIGYDAEWGVLSAESVGAEHERERIWIVAYSERKRQQRQGGFVNALDKEAGRDRETSGLFNAFQRGSMPYVCREHDDVAFGVDRLKAIGNGQVPQCAAEAFRQLVERINA